MALEAIIIRVDGALAETEDLRAKAFAHVFGEAGFVWNFTRDQFAASQRLGSSRARLAHFVRLALKGRPETQDISQLLKAMDRRASKIFGELLATASIEPRPGVRDVVTAARQEGLRLAVTSMLKPADTDQLLRKTFGSWATDAFTIVTSGEESDLDADAANAQLYATARDALGRRADACLALEATASGARGAEQAGFRVINTPSAFCSERGLSVSTTVFDDLSNVLLFSDDRRNKTLSADQRSNVIASLQRYHAGLFEASSEPDGRHSMRVADILKVKGSSVKTIEPDATLKAFAHGLNAERVGAMVVRDSTGALKGIISERDLVRGFSEFGAELSSMKVSELMTRSVITCTPDDGVAAIAKVMTQRRIRHLPVVVDGALVGLVSIGDVLKHRLDEVQLEANVLRDFAIARR
jgi:CBS domain-containing protein/beta-phosphoglucomutase-like phosphatase (HAD superfamily)